MSILYVKLFQILKWRKIYALVYYLDTDTVDKFVVAIKLQGMHISAICINLGI